MTVYVKITIYFIVILYTFDDMICQIMFFIYFFLFKCGGNGLSKFVMYHKDT